MGGCVNELEGRGEKRRGGVDDGDGGRLQEYVVDADSAPDINSRQKRKLAWRPHMMVLYQLKDILNNLVYLIHLNQLKQFNLSMCDKK